jgi:ketosteroid isomerase-like protein
MTESNVELTRHAIEAYNARDIEALIAYCDPSIEFYPAVPSAFAAVGGAVYHGHDGMRSWHRDYEDAWREIRLEPDAYCDLGQDTLVFFVLRGRGRHSGVEVAMPIATVFRWRDGLVVYFKGYADREDALSDLGVSEGELEPIEP